MSRFLKIEIPDDAFERASEAANSSGQSVEQWATRRVLDALQRSTTNGERPKQRDALLKYAGCVNDPRWVADNEALDDALAREAMNAREDDD